MEDIIEQLIDENEIISEMIDKNHLKIVLKNLKKVLDRGIEGDVVELGCNVGTTSLFIQRFLDYYNSDKKFHVYDSFEGLPEKTKKDESDVKYVHDFQKGSCTVPEETFINNFKLAGLKLPILHRGWFKDQEYPDKIAFAFFDGDFYTSIIGSFEKVYPKLTKGGIICVHDYGWDVLPGVKKACDDFFKDKPEKNYLKIKDNTAIVTKKFDNLPNKISIVIPCYNDGKYLKEAIESVETCDKNLYELIIVDDGSTDKFTINLFKDLKKRGYSVYRIRHKGQSAARNYGVKKSKYPYLLFLDSDNKVYPEYLVEGIRILDNNSNIGIVYGDKKYFNLENRVVKQFDYDILEAFLVKSFDLCSIMRKKVWQDCSGFDEKMDFYEDWEFIINAYEKGWKFYHIGKVLFEYRIKEESVNSRRLVKENRLRILDYVYKKHFNLFIDCIDEITVKYGADFIIRKHNLERARDKKSFVISNYLTNLRYFYDSVIRVLKNIYL